MIKITKKQRKQMRILNESWEKAEDVDLDIILTLFDAILHNRFETIVKRVNKGENLEDVLRETNTKTPREGGVRGASVPSTGVN